MKKTALGLISAVVLGAGACGLGAPSAGGESPDHRHSDRGGLGVLQQALAPTIVDVRRSLAVTDQVITSAFTLGAVLDQLAAQSGVAGMTGLQLFTQLWDTQNTAANGITQGPHCDDNANTLNGFPYQCRLVEGNQAFNAAAEIANYGAIGLYNRFDLASPGGADCGEYRMVFGRPAGPGRAFIIFEAVLPNPTPSLGLEGCRPVASFWAGLTANNDAASRATALHDFYFTGLPNFSPVIHIDNYGNTGLSRPTGQVRTNDILQFPWLLHEFKLQKQSATSVLFVPVTVKTNPFGDLFNANSANSQAAAFQNTFFPSQVAALAVNDINLFNYDVPDNFNTGQANSQVVGGLDDYAAHFSPASQLATNIQAQLTAIGSSLTPANIVARAEALSCAGCHQLSNGAALGGGLTWPSSTGFVQSSEATENGPDGLRFVISSALTSVFLPHRAQVLQGFLNRLPSASDYDGDRKADLGVYRPSTRTFNILTSTSNFTAVTTKLLGLNGDLPIGGADYDGDGKSDMTVFHPSDGTWTILTSSSGFTGSIVKTWGLSDDIPLSGADYDGDGTADIVVFRPSEGTWNILTSSSAFAQSIVTKFGASGDQPLAGADYDGDGKADLVIWRRGPHTMNVLLSSNQTLLQRSLAAAFGDIAVTGSDFDGDGKADMVTWSPTTFQWLVRTSTSNWQTSIQATWGQAGDVPLAGTDFDGDGRADFVVFRPGDGTWNVLTSSSNFTASFVKRFGNSTDRPLSH